MIQKETIDELEDCRRQANDLAFRIERVLANVSFEDDAGSDNGDDDLAQAAEDLREAAGTIEDVVAQCKDWNEDDEEEDDDDDELFDYEDDDEDDPSTRGSITGL